MRGGGAAPAVAHAEQPDLILLDQTLPGMDGIEVSRRLKADPATADIPIVTMCANQPLAPIQRAMGAVDRLAKPFTLAALYQTVARWCPRR